ncbi:carbohydrate ABC transporter permease [Rhodoferax sp.]|uniref:carbohydrate ABC transporter permease n=1 Tax=Rhodoferax sp. TaxID=50421 RepID=UPI0025D1E995|nr:carbohydrate ABC transporter permease [Rhodoferax sp.]
MSTASLPTKPVLVPGGRASWLTLGAVLFTALWLLPVVLIALSALSTKAQILSWPKSFFATDAYTLDTLKYFIGFAGVWPALLNSVKVASLTMVMATLLGAPAGYALARYLFRGDQLYRLIIVMTRAFPLAILALPLITRFIEWGIYDTVFGVAVVHTALALPFAILVTSSLFMGIPRELEEAALTLGCSSLGAFARIVVPLALPGIVATMIFSFVISWNEVFAATLLTLHERTLTAFLFTTLEEAPLHFRFAGAFLMIVPPIVFIFLVRKYLFSMWGISNR